VEVGSTDEAISVYIPLFFKEGLGEITGKKILSSVIPLHPPLEKGDFSQ
jgi:hypothetical protein